MNTMTWGRAAVSVCVLAALSFAAIALLAASPSGAASSGGIGPSGSGSGDRAGATAPSANRNIAKYDRLWQRISRRDRRWANRTATCESGRNPDAIGGGGRYRGAFQFLRSTWRAAPKSPGGDPIDYSYRTQAIVAIALKKRDGARHWPACG